MEVVPSLLHITKGKAAVVLEWASGGVGRCVVVAVILRGHWYKDVVYSINP